MYNTVPCTLYSRPFTPMLSKTPSTWMEEKEAALQKNAHGEQHPKRGQENGKAQAKAVSTAIDPLHHHYPHLIARPHGLPFLFISCSLHPHCLESRSNRFHDLHLGASRSFSETNSCFSHDVPHDHHERWLRDSNPRRYRSDQGQFDTWSRPGTALVLPRIPDLAVNAPTLLSPADRSVPRVPCRPLRAAPD